MRPLRLLTCCISLAAILGCSSTSITNTNSSNTGGTSSTVTTAAIGGATSSTVTTSTGGTGQFQTSIGGTTSTAGSGGTTAAGTGTGLGTGGSTATNATGGGTSGGVTNGVGGSSATTSSAVGGNSTGGRPAATGGAATGGAATGGAAPGGAAPGGAAPGGSSNCSLSVSRVLVDNAVGTLTANTLSCEPNCSLIVPCGTKVILTPTPGALSGFAGWDDPLGGCVGTTSPCSFNLTAASTVKATFQPYNRAFVTSSTYSPNIGGLTVANSKCQSLASTAGLPGASSYVAFLSTDTVNAIDSLGTARGWVRVDGQPFADSVANIKAGTLWYPLVLTENGVTAKLDGAVYTGSIPTGAKDTGNNCNGWTDATTAYNLTTGAIGGGSSIWLTWGNGNCTQTASAPIYCFGTSYTVPLGAPTSVAGRKVFLSTTKFVPGTGKTISDADAMCVNDAVAGGACAASSSCAFKAVLAQSGGSAKSHFINQDSTTPVVRLDNVKVANSASLFWAGTLTAPISLRPNGTYSNQGERVFSGASSPSTAGTAASTCSGWSDATITTGVNYGYILMGPGWFSQNAVFGCNYGNPIYCLEDTP